MNAVAYTLLDIGANIGWFTRQIINNFDNITRMICIEPDPGNFFALTFNLSAISVGRLFLANLALSDANGIMPFYCDASNAGNDSLNRDAMRSRQFGLIDVPSRTTDEYLSAEPGLAGDGRIIWKSDTQGSDELIVSLAPAAKIGDNRDFDIYFDIDPILAQDDFFVIDLLYPGLVWFADRGATAYKFLIRSMIADLPSA